MPPPGPSRQYGRGPGPPSFVEDLYLIGWEDRSVWGYDDRTGTFFAELRRNGSVSEEPEIWLTGIRPTYPWPSCIALEIVDRTRATPLAVVRAMGVADPQPTLRPRDEIEARVEELCRSRDHNLYDVGQVQALGWTLGVQPLRSPGSLRPSGVDRPPPSLVDAEHHMVTGRVHRGEDRDLYSGADTALSWAMGRDETRVEKPATRAPRVVAAPADSGTRPATRADHPVRVWLDIPYGEKDDAKSHGARWDNDTRRWYSPSPALGELARWAALPDIPDQLPGEDRSLGSGLFVDMVPSSCWFTNVRSCVVPRDWERLSRMITNRAGRCCEVCGQTRDHAAGRQLEAHERWVYDSQAGVQALRRLICLCTPCHTVTHFGLARITGKDREALAHLRAVTGMSDRQARAHLKDAGTLWTARSARAWTLDLSMLTTAGVTLKPPPGASDHAWIATRTLRRLR